MKKLSLALLVAFATLTVTLWLNQSNNATAKTSMPEPALQVGGSPIGTITAFGGNFSTANVAMLEKSGWLPCDGRPLRRLDAQGKPTAYAELFSVIGENFGEGYDRDIDPSKPGGSPGTKQGDFNLPDCRGRFLRGVSDNTGRDVDADRRSAMRQGGNTGNEVGSVQDNATKLPNTPFTTSDPGNHTHGDPTWDGQAGKYEIAVNNRGPGNIDYGNESAPTTAAGAHTHTISGGDGETRPKNINVNWIIKFR